MSEKQINHIIIITGMHRSGTSIVANIVQEMGYSFGEKAYLYMGGLLKRDNKFSMDGHHEHKTISDLNRKLISSVSKDLAYTITPEQGILNTILIPNTEGMAFIPKYTSIYQRIMKHIYYLNRENKWAIKDPRICLMLHIWQQLMNKIEDKKVLWFFVYRNPKEVIDSVITRAGKKDMPAIRKGRKFLEMVWNNYNIHILNFIEGMSNCCLFKINDVVNNFEQVQKQILEFDPAINETDISKLIDKKCLHLDEEPTFITKAAEEIWKKLEEKSKRF